MKFIYFDSIRNHMNKLKNYLCFNYNIIVITISECSITSPFELN
jgi:hypothetical protein